MSFVCLFFTQYHGMKKVFHSIHDIDLANPNCVTYLFIKVICSYVILDIHVFNLVHNGCGLCSVQITRFSNAVCVNLVHTVQINKALWYAIVVRRYRHWYRYDIDISDPKYRRYRYPLLHCCFAYSYISLSPAK